MIRKLKSTVIAASALIAGAFSASAEEALPAGYLQIDYIQSTGSQYVNTGYKPNKNTRIEAYFNTCARSGVWSAFFGALENDDATTGIQLRYFQNQDYLNGYFFGDGVNTAFMANKDVTVTLKAGLLKINDSEFRLNEVSGGPCAAELFIFAQNDVHTDGKTDDGGIRCQACKLYWFKIYEGDTPVRDYVPCRTPWNEIGLYDRVGKKFYGNCGSGVFAAPSNVPPPSREAGEVTLPQGFSQLDWIESTGTQHIDTGYLPKRATLVAASFKALTRNEDCAAFFGVMGNDSSDNAVSLRYYEDTYSINGLFCNGDCTDATTAEAYENADVMAALRDGAMVINGMPHGISTSDDPYQGSLILFGERNEGTIRRRQSMRLYWLTIYEGATVVHDYVPCLREQDGVRGLYDLVAEEFKPNDGTGAFKGPDVTAYAKLNGDGYTYYTTDGKPAAEPETGITGLPLAFANDAEYQALLAVPERVAQASGVVLEKDVTLTADVDWSACDFDFDLNRVGRTVNLDGHKLTVSRLNGEGAVADASGTGYQLLTYLQSDGKAYVNTGYKPNGNTRIEAHFNTGARTGVWSAFFGALKNDDTTTGIQLRYFNNQNRFNVYFFGDGLTTGGALNGMDLHVSLEAGLMLLNYTIDFGLNTRGGDLSCDAELFIFAQNDVHTDGKTDDGGNRPQACKLYFFKIYEGETLVHDFVPARRLPDGELGLLDLAQTGEAFRPNVSDGHFEAGLVTNVVSGGELHVNVASGEIANTGVALMGTLKLVKEGAGTFVAMRKGQTYCGGTQVSGGQFALWNDAADSTAWMPSTQGTLGAVGSVIDVDSGARFNIVGNYELSRFNIRLNGGQLESSNRPIEDVSGDAAFAQTQTGRGGVGSVTLTADSTYKARYDMVQNPGVVELDGHTLDLFTNGRTLHWGSDIRNGTLVVRNTDASEAGASGDVGLGYFRTDWPVNAYRQDLPVSELDQITLSLDMYEQFDLRADVRVKDYVSHTPDGPQTSHQGTAALNVYGTFTPVTDSFYGCTMQNGSTLDLSTRTGSLSLTSKSPGGRTTVDFAYDATIFINLGSRSDSSDMGRLVAWTAKPSHVTFKLAPATKSKAKLKIKDDGIYLIPELRIIVR